MKILLVEDEEDKRDDLSNFIKEKLTDNLIVARSFRTGKKALTEDHFDLILLDMTIPAFDITTTEDGGRSLPFGGRMLLEEMIRKRISTKVLVVTQFDLFGKGDDEISLSALDQQLFAKFPKIYFGAIQFSVSIAGWKDELLKKIKDLIKL